MKVTLPLSASSARHVRGCTPPRRHLGVANHTVCDRHAERTRHAECKTCTPAVNRNDDDDEDEEASAEEHRSLRRIVGKSQFLAPRRPDIA